MKKTVDVFICLKCGYEWIPRVKKPVQCPRCKSHNWDKGSVKEKTEVETD